jgi:hypothetical protein
MSRRNAHAVAARARKAGAHKGREYVQCEGCGKDMGFAAPSALCGPCDLVEQQEHQYLVDELKGQDDADCGEW